MSKFYTKPESATIEITDGYNQERVPVCSLEELETHIRAFIVAFVLPPAQPRWLEFLVERRSKTEPYTHQGGLKADRAMRMFSVDRQFCERIPNGQRTAAYYEATFGKAPAVYFALKTPPCKLTAVQADDEFTSQDACAILSFQAGKKVLFFQHGVGVFKFEQA